MSNAGRQTSTPSWSGAPWPWRCTSSSGISFASCWRLPVYSCIRWSNIFYQNGWLFRIRRNGRALDTPVVACCAIPRFFGRSARTEPWVLPGTVFSIFFRTSLFSVGSRSMSQSCIQEDNGLNKIFLKQKIRGTIINTFARVQHFQRFFPSPW